MSPQRSTILGARIRSQPSQRGSRSAWCERQPPVVDVVALRRGRLGPDGEQTEFPHIGPLCTEMSPGGPAPLIHHDGAWILLPQISLVRLKNGLLGSIPASLKFVRPLVPGSG